MQLLTNRVMKKLLAIILKIYAKIQKYVLQNENTLTRLFLGNKVSRTR